MTLRFPGKLARVPYTLKLLTVDGEQQIPDGTAGLHDPFTGAAKVRGGWFAAHSSETSSADGDTAETIGSYWAAHRVS